MDVIKVEPDRLHLNKSMKYFVKPLTDNHKMVLAGLKYENYRNHKEEIIINTW